jgi:hypothetical protein
VNTKPTEQQSLRIGREQILSMVSTFIGRAKGGNDEEHRHPPGRWDALVRVALEHVRLFGFTDQDWNASGKDRENASRDPRSLVFQSLVGRRAESPELGGSGPGLGDEAALNPQPLPPRYALFIAAAQAVIRRAELLEELASAATSDGSSQSVAIVSRYISRFSDDWCGTGFKLRWPFPGPRPHWFPLQPDGIDLIAVATQFEQAAREAFGPHLREPFATAAGKFAEAGMSRLQEAMDRHEGA